MRILVLNCFSRNALAVIKSLDPSIELFGGAPRRDGRSGGWRHRLRSPRLRSVFVYTHPERDAKAFRDDVIAACRRFDADAVFPTGTIATDHLSHEKREIEEEADVVCFVDEPERLDRLTDKWRTYELCREAGVPTPKTVLFPTVDDPLAPLGDLAFPIVVKPRRSFAAQGVRFFDDLAAVRRALAEPASGYAGARCDAPPFVAQEAVRGRLHDVALCSRRGEVVRMLTQKRVVSLYDFGGGGIVNLTTHEPDAMEHARRLMGHVGWTGPALLDLVKDEAGRFHVLECNPKIWGTAWLSTAAGQNVVQATADVFLGRAVEPTPGYEVGLLYRWILPECAFHWVSRPRRPERIARRMVNTFSRHGARRILHNLQVGDLRHLVGEVLN